MHAYMMQTGLASYQSVHVIFHGQHHKAPSRSPEHCRSCRSAVQSQQAVTSRRGFLASSIGLCSTVPMLVASGGQPDAGQVTPLPHHIKSTKMASVKFAVWDPAG